MEEGGGAPHEGPARWSNPAGSLDPPGGEGVGCGDHTRQFHLQIEAYHKKELNTGFTA